MAKFAHSIKVVLKQALYPALALAFLSTLPPAPSKFLTLSNAGTSIFESIQTQLTVAETIKLYGKDARSRLAPHFKKAKVAYPPAQVVMIGLKQEKVLVVFAKDANGKMKQVIGYPIIGTSGKSGPKLKEGDLQIPEGFYKVPGLYPNSIAHLGIRVNYPNSDDRLRGKKDKRTKLGGDILIHGSYWSTGCLAMGNTVIEELYVLANDAGCKNIDLIFSPCNFSNSKPDVDFKKQPAWLPPLYKELAASLKNYPIKIDPAWWANADSKPSGDDE